ncbi:MAG TPA: SCP2 sterol-binding domain-containing protein [Acidimicrobiia bacterium]|nr:SCP2 sterol-binding domain-containing protein [Acidimicrobiia bacterium]
MTTPQPKEEIVPTFQSPDEVYTTMGAFLAEITKAPDMRAKFTHADTSFLVNYTDPACRILVDCTQDPPVVTNDPPEDAPAEIRLGMSADDAHRFWQGKLNMTVALAKKQVQVAGPMAKMMKLLPALRPAFPRYVQFLEANGHADKVI